MHQEGHLFNCCDSELAGQVGDEGVVIVSPNGSLSQDLYSPQGEKQTGQVAGAREGSTLGA